MWREQRKSLERAKNKSKMVKRYNFLGYVLSSKDWGGQIDSKKGTRWVTWDRFGCRKEDVEETTIMCKICSKTVRRKGSRHTHTQGQTSHKPNLRDCFFSPEWQPGSLPLWFTHNGFFLKTVFWNDLFSHTSCTKSTLSFVILKCLSHVTCKLLNCSSKKKKTNDYKQDSFNVNINCRDY